MRKTIECSICRDEMEDYYCMHCIYKNIRSLPASRLNGLDRLNKNARHAVFSESPSANKDCRCIMCGLPAGPMVCPDCIVHQGIVWLEENDSTLSTIFTKMFFATDQESKGSNVEIQESSYSARRKMLRRVSHLSLPEKQDAMELFAKERGSGI